MKSTKDDLLDVWTELKQPEDGLKLVVMAISWCLKDNKQTDLERNERMCLNYGRVSNISLNLGQNWMKPQKNSI